MSVDLKELQKEIDRLEHDKPLIVQWSRIDEFRFQVMKELYALRTKKDKTK